MNSSAIAQNAGRLQVVLLKQTINCYHGHKQLKNKRNVVRLYTHYNNVNFTILTCGMHTHICIRANTYMYTHTQTHAYTNTHTHTHTHTHTRTHMLTSLFTGGDVYSTAGLSQLPAAPMVHPLPRASQHHLRPPMRALLQPDH